TGDSAGRGHQTARACGWPGAEHGAAIPAAGVQEYDVARADPDVLDLFDCFEMPAHDPRARRQPWTTVLTELGQERRIQQHATREDPDVVDLDPLFGAARGGVVADAADAVVIEFFAEQASGHRRWRESDVAHSVEMAVYHPSRRNVPPVASVTGRVRPKE